MAINNLQSRHRIRAGQVLALPYGGTAGSAVRQAAVAIEPGTQIYTVRSGDTLGQIAERAGISEQDLLANNGLANGNRIYVGQKLSLIADETTDETPVNESGQLVAAEQMAKWPDGEEEPDRAPADAAEEQELSAAVAASVEAPADQGGDMAMLADPSDYLVATDGTIEIQAEETLGHYASWLNIRTQKLRDLNDYEFRKPAVIGHHLRLDFTRVTQAQFEAKRIAYHRELQEAFFARYRIADTKVHEFRQGDSLFVLSLRRYKVPVWLLRQYNPDLDLDLIKPGTSIVIPQIERVDHGTEAEGTVADA